MEPGGVVPTEVRVALNEKLLPASAPPQRSALDPEKLRWTALKHSSVRALLAGQSRYE